MTNPVKIFALNLGSTSTKVAYFENGGFVLRQTLEHPAADLAPFKRFWDQEDYRRRAIDAFMKDNGLDPAGMDAFVTWGGHTEPVEDGVYRITPEFLEQSASEKYGNHPGDLGPRLAFALAKANRAEAFTIDPPTIDEFEPSARYTGLPEIRRKSRMQSLNQKATARRFARDSGKRYEDMNLIVIHMGGGFSVVVHKKGRMVDANNGLDGDGPMAPTRAGTLPAGDLIDLCYSGKYTREEMRKKITGLGGLAAYLGETDGRIIEKKIEAGDVQAKEVYDAMLYQLSKEIGASAAVLCGDVDAVLFTGGLANSGYVIDSIRKRVSFIAPVHVMAGELEMESLGLMGYAALTGNVPIKELSSRPQ